MSALLTGSAYLEVNMTSPVRVLGPVVEVLVRAMLDRGHDLAPGCGIGAELVGNHAPGRTALLLEKTRKRFAASASRRVWTISSRIYPS
jgi:hypothetical protein